MRTGPKAEREKMIKDYKRRGEDIQTENGEEQRQRKRKTRIERVERKEESSYR